MFPKEVGDLKIIDEKYGFEIWKQKNFPPKMFCKKQVNRCPVLNIDYDETKEEIILKLKPNEESSFHNTPEKVILSKGIVKQLYEMFIK